MQQPKLDVRKLDEAQGVYGWALFREDRVSPIIRGISKAHAHHLKKICSRMTDLPEHIEPIKDWYDFDEIVDVTPEGFGKKK
jgi:hypothetical protein